MTWSEVDQEQRDREDALGRALRALPAARAPHTLAPRVMALVQARLDSPAARTWFDWPVWAQAASVVLFVTMVAGVALVWPSVEAMVFGGRDLWPVRAATAVGRTVWQPMAWAFVMCVTALGLICAICGALLGRAALGLEDVEEVHQ